MAKTATPNIDPNAVNRIGEGTIITGDINSNEGIRFDGVLNGNLISKGKVFIGVTGKINGEVNCKNLEVEGKVEGKIKVEELLSLKSSAKIYGDINTNKLAVEPNAVFTGTCNMGQMQQDNGQKSQEKK